jgi:hypothetical protein
MNTNRSHFSVLSSRVAFTFGSRFGVAAEPEHEQSTENWEV